MDKKIIFSIIAIIIILVAVFLSQQEYSRKAGKTLISNATNQAKAHLSDGANWAMSKIYPKISGEVQKRGDIITNAVNQEKQKVSENILQKVGNYFSGIENSIVHPGTPQNCQPVQPNQTTRTSSQTN